METSTNLKRKNSGDNPPSNKREKTMLGLSIPTPVTSSAPTPITSAVTTPITYKTTFIIDITLTPSTPKVTVLDQKNPFKPNINPLKSNFIPIGTIICDPLLSHTALFSSLSLSLSVLSQAVLSVSFSINTAENPIRFIKNPARQVGLNGGPTRPSRTIIVLCGIWGAPRSLSALRSTKTTHEFRLYRKKTK